MSEHDRKPESEPQFLTGHDEPVVVDNGPATVMFGTKHEPTGSNGGKTWTREADDFFALYVQEEAANGQVTFVDSWSLATPSKEISLIRITLENNERFEFTLVPDGSKQNVQMTSLTTGLDRDNGNGRLTFKGGRNVLVTQVEGFKGTTRLINYTPMTSPKHIKVVILLKPERP